MEGGGDKKGPETTRAAGTVDNGYDDERDSRRECVSSLGPRDVVDVSWAVWKVLM